MGRVNSVKAKCHPSRPHEALGLCNSCYVTRKQLEKKNQNPEKYKRDRGVQVRKHYLRKHGWTLDMVRDAKIKQKNLCAICKTVMINPQADHEHTEPPNPRELLCRPCNVALGLFKDSPKILRKAAKYIEKHRR